ncbi:RNA polymerase II transcription factor SIII subunit A-domain-containing protein [Lactifluus volemus]|nr:RNA polymerase II transcription factor SIII subunit A-domain-containing protein [Lactifluus volemus]
MSSEIDPPGGRIPSLVCYCRRVAAAHIGGIVSLGDNVSYELVRPILESCSADDLRRLEDATPHLRAHTDDLWELLCFREHLAEVDCFHGSSVPPKPWRHLFFDLRAKKEKRLEEISARMKRQRLEAEERKKQKEIKITDCVPPMKRARGWPVSPQQKSLFQKTRSEASKIQRTMFEPRMRLPMPASHTNRQRVQSVISSSSSLIHPTSGTRVIVRPVPVGQRPTELPGSPSAGKKTTANVQNRPQGSQPLDPTAREKQTSVGAKKEPSCSLFMPKHRAHSQLTSRLVPSHASPTR